MDVLIACEESQEVCKAFRRRGHNAFSCDIIDCSGGRPEWHIKGDAIEALYSRKWDLVIAFPPCTDLAVSGSAWFKNKQKDGRQQASIDFFMQFAKYDGRYAIENPVGIMSRLWRKPDQIIQPYHHGHEAQKSTCLWLNGLVKLKKTNLVGKGEFVYSPDGSKRMPSWSHGTNLQWSSPEIKKLRSKTFSGIAEAMAFQWADCETNPQLYIWNLINSKK